MTAPHRLRAGARISRMASDVPGATRISRRQRRVSRAAQEELERIMRAAAEGPTTAQVLTVREAPLTTRAVELSDQYADAWATALFAAMELAHEDGDSIRFWSSEDVVWQDAALPSHAPELSDPGGTVSP